ncbi:MAG: hypothetical protein EZS28_024782 [Streblomastix strix]|uniref:Uncharacterized protein n=1 Tax=Streblomastix strix TaxID=222440 RepID=A0A5J4VB09_9EUKA|nr:MAG: hypothetical protein EZS28_024782 [Streblomastix strix]
MNSLQIEIQKLGKIDSKNDSAVVASLQNISQQIGSASALDLMNIQNSILIPILVDSIAGTQFPKEKATIALNILAAIVNWEKKEPPTLNMANIVKILSEMLEMRT